MDWANLGDGPAGLIAERVLASDVADYVRFRAVCRPWRRCTADPRAHVGLDRRFHPRQWIMLREELAAPHRRRFLNVSTGECIQMDLTELSYHDVLGLTSEGFLVLLHESTRVVSLLNPLTRQLTGLPPVTTLQLPGGYSSENLNAWGSGIASDSTVVLYFSRHSLLAVSKPGDEYWTLVNHNHHSLEAPLMFAGHFYCITTKDVMVLEVRADQPPRLEVAVELDGPLYGMTKCAHLVDNGGEFMLVNNRERPVGNGWRWSYDVYRVDLDTQTLFAVKSFGGRSVFMGTRRRCSLSVSTNVFPFITGDTIYLSDEFTEGRMGELIEAYHLADESTKPSNYMDPDGSMPQSVVDCLSSCITVSPV